jgi:hypothetical protein
MQPERMADLMRQFPDAVADARGAFHARAVAHEREDGSWEGWLEFVPADADASIGYATPIETHQRDRVTMERWASGLTHVYAEGALARARVQQAASEPLFALQEIVEALGRRIPQLERAGEAQIAADAERLRETILCRIEHLQGQEDVRITSTPCRQPLAS